VENTGRNVDTSRKDSYLCIVIENRTKTAPSDKDKANSKLC